ncbi:MAG: protoporphyrinogen oxidase [Parachlamydiales bacterium]|jgi:oxygen-dependent protoporphyrinogen oxidase
MALKVVILGGGITGLAAAWYVEHFLGNKVSVTLIEKSARLGGWIQTVQDQNFLFEKGPRSMRSHTHDGAAVKLIELLGLQNEVITSSPTAKDRYVWHDDKLIKAPAGILQMLTSPLTRDLVGTFLKEWTRKKGNGDDESVHEFISRRYSPVVAERLINPLVACIYGGDIHQLSIESCFPFLKAWENKYGSIMGGVARQVFKKKSSSPSSLISFRHGMETLPKRLAEQLKGEILLKSEAIRLQASKITLSNGTIIPYDMVISTLPSPVLGKITSIPEIFLPSASIAVVNMGWDKKVLRHEGFGCVFPTRAKLPLLGIVWDSSAFPDQNKSPDQTRITLMLGGNHSPVFPSLSDQTIQSSCLELISSHLNISSPPQAIHIGRAFHAIPHYPVGHKENSIQWKKILKDFFPSLWIAGSPFDGVAVPACLSSARNIAFDVSEFAKKTTPI